MIFFISIRAAALVAAALVAGAAAATPYQRADLSPARAGAENCPGAAVGESCDHVAMLLDMAAGQGQSTALYQDLLTPLEESRYTDARDTDAAAAPVAAPPAAPATPVPEQQPYTMLLIGLGLLVFKSRKKYTEKFSA
jgi:hypothetical protein